MNHLPKLAVILTSCLAFTVQLQAQTDDFQTANRLIEQQDYYGAIPILEALVQDYPDAGIFFDRLLDCLEQLKQYEDAISMTENRIRSGNDTIQLQVRLAELHHLNGNRDLALEKWYSVLDAESQNLQVYYSIGNVMSARREYEEAVKIYELARVRFDDSVIFANELADVQLQSGNFSGAVEEYIRLVRSNPSLLGSVQQKLVGMQDQNLYRIAAIQLEDYLVEREPVEGSYNILHQLLVWMLMETEQYERALVNARQYESETDFITYSLYMVGGQLHSNNQFELAARAFGFYESENNNPVRFQAMEQQALVYQNWAEYLSENSLESADRQKQLVQTAYDLNRTLLEEAVDYNNRERILVRQAEMALDTFYDVVEAGKWAEAIPEAPNGGGTMNAARNYILGRIHLAGNYYAEARRLLTRANRDSEDAEMIEKTRYFLSLSDFYAGDFEFARLQLRSIERRNTSSYANEALKLGLWIREGLRYDSTGSVLASFAEMLEHLMNGEITNAVSRLTEMTIERNNPLVDDAIAEMTVVSDPFYLPHLYSLISRYNSEVSSSPLRERLLWEEANLAQALYSKEWPEEVMAEEVFIPETDDGSRLQQLPEYSFEQIPEKGTAEKLYEQLIMEFPSGFYAPYARTILQTLTETGI